MPRYLLLRVGAFVPTLLAVTALCFALVHLLPGGPVEHQLAAWSSSASETAIAITDAHRSALREYYGFDRPLAARYFQWLQNLARFDLGRSYHYLEPVTTLIARALPVSATLGLCALLLTYLVSVPLGLRKALREGSRFDTISTALLLAGYAVPPFALATLCLSALTGDLFPTGGLVSENFAALGPLAKAGDLARHLTLPVLCYTAGHFAVSAFLVKHSLQEQMGQEYVLVARAKGLSERETLLRHVFRNGLFPLVNGVRDWLGYFFAGSLLVESVFDLHGIGRLTYEAVTRRDYPVVLGIIWCLSLAQVLGNFIGDIALHWADPRLRPEAK